MRYVNYKTRKIPITICVHASQFGCTGLLPFFLSVCMHAAAQVRGIPRICGFLGQRVSRCIRRASVTDVLKRVPLNVARAACLFTVYVIYTA